LLEPGLPDAGLAEEGATRPPVMHSRTSAFDELQELQRIEGAVPPPGRRWVVWLLLVPLAIVIYPPAYSHRHPAIAGVPFFVWYQILAVVAGAAVTGLVYLLLGTERQARS
jgi:hypothetical protein